MPQEVDSCVESMLADDPEMDESRAYAICYAEQKAKEGDVADPLAIKAVAAHRTSGEWHGYHPAEKTRDGRIHLLKQYEDIAGGLVEAYESGETELQKSPVKFKASVDASIGVLFKDDDRMVIWGPASLEIVDKEQDRITADALERALPQLLRRKRFSLEHTDQLVGDILESHETEEPVEVTIDGHVYERSEFPTAVLRADEDDVPEDGLFVAGELYGDTKQSRETQKKIENGEIDSYSISGEAIETKTKVEDGSLVDDIKVMDLSAVTLCEEGMNQGAKFAVISKNADSDGITIDTLSETAKTALAKHMTDSDTDENGDTGGTTLGKEELHETFKEATNEVLEDRNFATKDDILTREDVESIVEEHVAAKDYDEEIRDKAAELADKHDMEMDKALAIVSEMKADDDVDADEIEDPDDDGDEELDLPVDDEEDDDEEEEPPEIEAAKAEAVEEIKSALPDDLAAAVDEHTEVEAKGDYEDEMDDEEDDEEEKADDVEKSATDSYVDSIAGPVLPKVESETTEKSYDQDGEGGKTTEKSGDGLTTDISVFYEEDA